MLNTNNGRATIKCTKLLLDPTVFFQYFTIVIAANRSTIALLAHSQMDSFSFATNFHSFLFVRKKSLANRLDFH